MTPSNNVLFRTGYFDYLQDINAALLMSQIHYWYMPSKDTGKSKLKVLKLGKWWLAKSATDWWDECRLTKKQVFAAVNLLSDKGLISYEVFRFNNQPTRHFRSEYLEQVPVAARLSFVPSLENITSFVVSLPSVGKCLQAPQSSLQALQSSLQALSLTETTAETTQKEELVQSTKDKTMIQKNPGKGKVPNSSAEILKQLKAVKSPPAGDTVSVNTLLTIWRHTVPAHNSSVKFVGEFTLQQKGMFSRLLVRWGGPSNTDIAPMLGYVLSNWTKFVKFVEEVSGAKNTPSAPTILFLLKYCEEGRNLYLASQETAPVFVKATPAKQTTATQPVMVPVEEEMSLEDLKAIGEKFGVGKKK